MTTTDSQTPTSSQGEIASIPESVSSPGMIVEESINNLSDLLASAEIPSEAPVVEAKSHPHSIESPEAPSGPSDTESSDGNELPNLALAPDEVATLQSLVLRYDQVIAELDRLNGQIESLLQSEGIKACES